MTNKPTDGLISRKAVNDVIGQWIKTCREKGDYEVADGLILLRRYDISSIPSASIEELVEEQERIKKKKS